MASSLPTDLGSAGVTAEPRLGLTRPSRLRLLTAALVVRPACTRGCPEHIAAERFERGTKPGHSSSSSSRRCSTRRTISSKLAITPKSESKGVPVVRFPELTSRGRT